MDISKFFEVETQYHHIENLSQVQYGFQAKGLRCLPHNGPRWQGWMWLGPRDKH